MTVKQEARQLVRERADFACEYCGVSEVDAGGELTVDHFQPVSKGGADEPENLIYCCPRCNQHKQSYWPEDAEQPVLWNPRVAPSTEHLQVLADGTLLALTDCGEFTLKRLQLNRPALIEHRRRRMQADADAVRLLQYQKLVRVMPQMQVYYLAVIEQQRQLLQFYQSLFEQFLEGEKEE